MKHFSATRKLGRVRKQRVALLRSLAKSLIIHDRIETTEAKAKELRPYIEKLITKSKTNSLSTQRLIIARLGGNSEREATKLLKEIAPKYKDRSGGYTRITKLGGYTEDGRKNAIIEFV